MHQPRISQEKFRSFPLQIDERKQTKGNGGEDEKEEEEKKTLKLFSSVM